MKILKIILILSITIGCKKEGDSNQENIKLLDVGQKYGNGVIGRVSTINDEASGSNSCLYIVGLNEIKDVTYEESFTRISALKDQFGEWNFMGASIIQSRPGMVLDAALQNNGGVPFSKNLNFWRNNGITSTQENGYWFLLNDGIINGGSTNSKTVKYNLRPDRYVALYNKKINNYKIGDQYKCFATVFNVDAVNKKIKIYTRGSGALTSWNNENDRIRTLAYNGDYGFRLPTLNEMKQIQLASPNVNFSGVWTSTIDPQNSNNAFQFATNRTPQQESSQPMSMGNTSYVGVKEVDY
jgi:hypothetical protein